MRVLVDTDGGVDDLVALDYLLSCGLVDVVGISTVAGNVSVGQALSNVIDLLTVYDRDILCACNWMNDRVGRGDARHGLDTNPREVDGTPLDAWLIPDELVLEAMAGGSVTVLALGPLTNVAGFVHPAASSERSQRLERIVWMGGDGDDLGGEFNAAADPDATHVVLHSAISITRVPLTITNQVSQELPDAVAAVTLTRPDLFDVDPETGVVRGVDVDEVTTELRRALAHSPLLRG